MGLLMFATLSAMAGIAWIESSEMREALKNGYVQAVDEKSGKVLWVKNEQ